jgi:hypothetical protein
MISKVEADVLEAGEFPAIPVATSSSGAYWYESTVFNNYDRVIYVYHPWSYFSAYQPRRSLDVCGGNPSKGQEA